MKKNRGHEPNQVIIHIYMGMSKGNSLCTILKQEKMSFFSYKIDETRLPGRVGTSGRGGDGGEGVGG
jgi:hypothetical protein